jgi:hypothetical protein
MRDTSGGFGGAWRERRKPSFGLDTGLKLDPALSRWVLRQALSRQPELLAFVELAEEHGRPLLVLPFQEPGRVGLMPRLLTTGEEGPKQIFEIPPVDEKMVKTSKSLAKAAAQLGTTPEKLIGTRLWIVYQNDGGLPFNPGSGSDQGPTAFLGLYLSFDQKKTGLTRIGWTVIDMRTPRGSLPAGVTPSSKEQYTSPPGPYSGISSLDFTVTVERTRKVKVDFTASVGIDSTQWGKFVQDFIHTKVSNSPLFPWPKDQTKFYYELGVAALVTPDLVLKEGDVYGIQYTGKLEFGGKATVGSNHTEATANARVVIRTATVKVGDLSINAEYTFLGVFARGFLRYNDGRDKGFAGVEGGVNSALMLNVGRLGIGLKGEMVISTDPALQTGNPAGSSPLLNPLSQPIGSDVQTGGPAGHHGTGQLVLTWTF